MFQNLENILEYKKLHESSEKEINKITKSYRLKIENFGDKLTYSMFLFGAISIASSFYESRFGNPLNLNYLITISSFGFISSILTGIIGQYFLYKKQNKLINEIENSYNKKINEIYNKNKL